MSSADDNPGVFVPPPLMFAVAVALGTLIDGNPLEWRHVFHPSQLPGAFVALVGLALIIATLVLFRRNGTRPEPWEPALAFIASGPYRYSRNPMYAGMALVSAGIAIFFESIAAIALVGAVVIVIDRYVIVREEAYLRRRFSDEYDAYCARVRRWL